MKTKLRTVLLAFGVLSVAAPALARHTRLPPIPPDLAAINGYYTFLATAMNTARMPVTDGPKLPRFPD